MVGHRKTATAIKMSRFNIARNLLKETINNWQACIPSQAAAALAYRGIFAVTPILLIAMAEVSIVFGRQAARKEVSLLFENVMGDQVAQLIEASIASIAQQTSTGRPLTSIIGLGVLLYAATNLFKALKIALNTIWGAPPWPRSGLFTEIRNRLVGLTIVLVVGLFFLLLFIINTAFSLLDTYLAFDYFFTVIQLAASFGALTLIIAVLFKYVPDVNLAWKEIWLGAGVTALLLVVGMWGISLYLTYSNLISAFGAAEAVIVVLIWIYYSAQVFLFGAGFTKAYIAKFGAGEA